MSAALNALNAFSRHVIVLATLWLCSRPLGYAKLNGLYSMFALTNAVALFALLRLQDKSKMKIV